MQVTAVIVCYQEDVEHVAALAEELFRQTAPPDEVLVVDNDPAGGLSSGLSKLQAEVRCLAPGVNLGYTGGVNLAAAHARGRYIVCLNPDAHPQRDCFEQLLAVAESDRMTALVGAQILLEDGVRRNAGANPLHPSGISPSGGYGEPREAGIAREVAVVSGACCLFRKDAFEALDGFVDELFLYYDDVDIAWRARIAGMRVLYCPAAVVTHRYEFSRHGRKWFYLERNRLFSVLANYELRTIVLLWPLLVLTELGVLAMAARGGWLSLKLESYRSLMMLRARLIAQRRAVRAARVCPDAEVMRLFDDRIQQSPLLPGLGPRIANAVSVPYMRVIRPLLRGAGR